MKIPSTKSSDKGHKVSRREMVRRVGGAALLLPFLSRIAPANKAHLVSDEDVMVLRFQAAHIAARSNNPEVLKAIIALGEPSEPNSASVRKCLRLLGSA
jgi:hypothetical protein